MSNPEQGNSAVPDKDPTEVTSSIPEFDEGFDDGLMAPPPVQLTPPPTPSSAGGPQGFVPPGAGSPNAMPPQLMPQRAGTSAAEVPYGYAALDTSATGPYGEMGGPGPVSTQLGGAESAYGSAAQQGPASTGSPPSASTPYTQSPPPTQSPYAPSPPMQSVGGNVAQKKAASPEKASTGIGMKILVTVIIMVVLAVVAFFVVPGMLEDFEDSQGMGEHNVAEAIDEAAETAG